MENAETILVVILSSFLAVFLALGITLLIICIKIVSRIQRITAKAENIVDQAEDIGEFFKKASGSFALTRLIAHIANSVFHHEDKHAKRRQTSDD